MKSRRESSRCRQLLLGLGLIIIASGTALGQAAARPDRGTMPNRTYSVSDIENISLQNGNVNLSIPLAALPPIAGGKLSWVVSARYNSKLWNVTRSQQDDPNDLEWHPYVVDTPQLSDLGGWIGGGYRIYFRNSEEDFDRQWYPGNSGLTYQELYWLNDNQWWKVVLITPDGAEQEFRPTDFSGSAYPGSQDFLRGYYNVKPNGSPMRYYSGDGSFLFATISSTLDWTVYMPDGTKVIQTPDGIQRIQDTNGNKIKFFSDTEGSHIQDEQTGREIKGTYDPAANGGQGQSQVWYQTVDGWWQHIDLNWGTTTVQGKSYIVDDWLPSGGETGGGIVCQRFEMLGTTEMTVLKEIVFPQTEPGQAQRKFTFTYNSDTTETATEGGSQAGCNGPVNGSPRPASLGWGELSHMVTPSGGIVDYSYTLDGVHSLAPFGVTDYMTYQSLTEKKVTHDGTFDTWTYSINDSFGSVAKPDGSGVTEVRHCSLPGTSCATDKAGLVYRSSRPFMMTERHWTNLQFSGAHINSPGGILAFNAVVDFEYTTLLDAGNQPLKMSARAYQFDYNGSVTQTTEYDWFDPALVSRDAQGVPTGVPGSATVLRTVSNDYYNQATGSTSGNVYAKRSLSTGTPLILNAQQQTSVGPRIVQLSYDGNSYGIAPTVGNLTSKSVWDDLDNKWITTSTTYGPYGNVATATDARGKVTQFFYDDATHALPNRVTVDPQNGTGTQTTSTAFDYYTGAVTITTDANNNTATIDYTNQLLGTVDPFGRPGVTVGPLVNVGGINQRHRSKTIYEDSARIVTVLSDLNAEGDGLLKSQVISDMLGRTIESRQFETAQNFIAVRKTYEPQNRLSRTSNPFRTGETVLWTTAVSDLAGRIVSITTPDNAVVSTSYGGNTVTVTDQAGKSRRSLTDALGRLVRVDEPDGSNNLGSTTSPAQPTSYAYDVLGNLLTVTQGSQTRTFNYDSLSRLRSAINPESGTITYSYDDNANLRFKTDARGIVTENRYDALNRVTTILYRINGQPDPNTGDVEYLYDNATNGKGRLWLTLTWGANPFQTVVGNYDAMGRVTRLHNLFGNGQGGWYPSYDINRTYDLAGQVLTETYPSGRTVTNTYDSAGRTSSVTGNLGDGTSRTYATGISYSPFGGIAREQYGTTTPLYHKTFYNIRGQMFDTRVSSVNDTWDWNRGRLILYYSSNHVWGQSGTDNNGNVRFAENWIPPANATLDQAEFLTEDSYTYDSLNRLSAVNESSLNIAGGGSWTSQFAQGYTYDRYGNRTINTGATWGTGINNKQFTVDATNNRLGVPSGQTGTMSYDAGGNLTNDTYTGQGQRTYDAENRMKQAWANNQWQTYTYDGHGRRVRRNVNGTEIWQVYGLGGELLAEYAQNGAPSSPQKEYGYRNGQLLITADAASGGGGGSGPQPVTWTNAVGVTVNSNSLTKTAGDGWGNAGAVSTQSIASGDGHMEFTASETNKYRLIGLSNGDSNQDYTDIDYAFYLIDGGGLWVLEDGVTRSTGQTFATGDTLRVAVEGGVVKYRRNGTLIYTSTVAPTYPLLVDTALYNNGSTLTNVSMSGGGGGSGSSAQIHWLVTDQLGTPRMVFDQTGSLANMSRHDYLPFGEELFAGTGGRTTAQGYTINDSIRQKFTSKERDIETGLDYFLARYYSSTQGRFTSPDEFTGGPDELYTFVDDASDNPTFYSNLRNPQSLNKYQYAYNNPLRYVDPDGHDPDPEPEPDCCDQKDTNRRVATGAGVGAAIGAGVGAVLGANAGSAAGAAGGTLVEPGGGTIVVGVGGAIAGGTVGAIKGAAAGAVIGGLAGYAYDKVVNLLSTPVVPAVPITGTRPTPIVQPMPPPPPAEARHRKARPSTKDKIKHQDPDGQIQRIGRTRIGGPDSDRKIGPRASRGRHGRIQRPTTKP